MEKETAELRAKFKKVVAEKQQLEREIKEQNTKLVEITTQSEKDNQSKDEKIKQLEAL
jgi:hypothetical protein